MNREAESSLPLCAVEVVELPAGGAVQDEVPNYSCNEDFVEIACPESLKTANGEDAVVSSLGASDGERLVHELGLVTDQSEHKDGTLICGAGKSVCNSSLVEDTDDPDAVDVGSKFTVVAESDHDNTSDVSPRTLPTRYVDRQTLEPESVLSTSISAGCDTLPTESDNRFASAESVEGDARDSATPSTSHRDGAENPAAGVRDIGSASVAIDEGSSSANSTDSEPDTERRDPECISEQRDRIREREEHVLLGRERNHVYRLARKYSSRIKEMNESTSPHPRFRFLALRRKSTGETLTTDSAASFTWSQLLTTRKDEVSSPAAESGHSSRHEMISKWNSVRRRAKSVDETASFPQTNVRETILKLKQKALSSNVTCPPGKSGLLSPISESCTQPSLNAEVGPQQSVGTDACTTSSGSRQPGSLVQERVRMFHSGGKLS